jgi:MFS family permease
MTTNFLLQAMHVLNDGYAACLPLLLPFVKKELPLTLSQIGALGAVLNFSGIALALPAGALAGRWGGLRILSRAAVLYSAAFLIVAWAGGYAALLAAFALASLGFGIFHPVAFSAVARSSAPAELGRRMGAFTAVGDIGRIAMAAAVTALVARVAWRPAALSYGIVGILLGALLVAAAARIPAARGAGERKRLFEPALLRNRNFLLVNATGALDAFASSSLFLFLPFLLVERGSSPALLGSFTGAFFLGNLLGKTALGAVVDRVGNKRVFLVSEALMAAAVAAMAFASSLPVIVALALLVGILSKGTVPVLGSMIADASRRDGSFEQAYGMSSFVTSVSNAVAPAVLGIAAEAFGVERVFLICAAVALAALVPCALVSRAERP